ncbi:MAG: class I SAM-dependent methyltransferase [Marivita sp.]|uniref:class I SAM-dependent methyltransferase n=1 Tax=Marivita sp. TaxID=2003365 RepID=UPI0025C564E5|nr:class I SAM-dependent methyltransferase [Marivita sp.]MCI5110216.1 class I SAM-dependent methyltransferase [Marivita sp.]
MFEVFETPDSALSELQTFREKLRAQVEEISKEVMLREKMNAPRAEAICVRIDGLVRDYTGFLAQFKNTQMSLENAVRDRDALVSLRREWGVASSRANLLRVELNQWTLMRELVQSQINRRRKRIPLYDLRRSDLTMSQVTASDAVFNWLHAVLNPEDQSEEARDNGYFPDIALANSFFHQHLHAAYRVLLAQGQTKTLRFLDVGCGGGLKVLSARRYFLQADGLDFQQSYVDAAQKLLTAASVTDCAAFQADALTFDQYGAYDVIYFYRPIQDPEALERMEHRIVEQARPGAVLIAPYVGFEARFAQLGCGRVAGSVYLAKSSQKQADQWRRKAEQTGVAVVAAEARHPPTVWEPLLAASRLSGYELTRHKPLI